MDMNMGTSSTEVSASLLKSVKVNALASKLLNIEGKILPRRYTTYQEPLKDSGPSKVSLNDPSLDKPSFSSMVQEKPQKWTVKIKELRNKVCVSGAAVTLLIEAVETVNARFTNTLYGYFIGDRLAFPLVENYVKNTEGMESVLENVPWLVRRVPLILNEWTPNTILKKDEIKRVPVWVKMHHVPIVAYSEVGLSLISTQIGRRIMLDSYTSNMCLNSWGRSAYARALIDIAADVELVKSLVVAIPFANKEGHMFATIDIEYEWTPPRCATCYIFYHVSEKCPKLPKKVPATKADDEGFIEVKKKMVKAKQCSKKQVEGIQLNKPPLNLQYHRVNKGEASKQKVSNNVSKVSTDSNPPQNLNETSKVTTKNSFSALWEEDSNVWDDTTRVMTSGSDLHIVNDSDSEDVDEYITMEEDFNASLYVDDTSIGASTLDITMREFKECVDTMKVMDVQRTGLQFTWNQKPKGKDGFHMFRMVKKLKGLKNPIRKLMYDKGNLHANVVRLRDEPDKVQTDLDGDPNNLSIWEKEAAMVVTFNEALIVEEKFLKQKAKVTWLKEGDSNTAYFHKAVKSHVSRSRIDVVTDANGAVFQNEEVAKAQEVKSAMFSIGGDKSPGPDGFTAAFFKDTWDIIGADVTHAVCEFFTNGRLLMELNHTIIDLIPKMNAPARVNDYRPISCCNVLFKCISKIIANHLNDSLKRLLVLTNLLLCRVVVSWTTFYSPKRLCIITIWIVEFRVMLLKLTFKKRKRGLCQGDLLSPYLFTLIMEVFTLMLYRRVREASSFTYHRFCSELELTNLCFADDLFLFAHGDVNSVKVIKEALDEFKDASGLNPRSSPGEVPWCSFVLSRLIFRGCKELIEKVQNRVNDWKNKSLSIAGRLQLIQYVLGSLHVFWASVFMLPTRVLLDIEQIMHGFLWCQGSMSRGKAKVAWEVMCLPKQEGGLSVHRLDHFNKALMVSHVWKLLSLKESLPIIREFIWTCIGDGNLASMWFDKWCAASPLYNTISSCDIARAGFTHASKVCDCIQDGLWNGRMIDGIGKQFLVHNVWESIRPRDNLVPWYDLVWFHACIPRHAFNMWLIFKQRLRTQDCLRSWEVVDGLAVVCLICETQPDSHEHLFFDCLFSQQVWRRVQHVAGLGSAGPSLASIMSSLMPITKRKSSKSCIGKLVLAVAAYFV
nr:hypothetical protein [Tanacetum cinerariifolium]